MRRLQVSLEVVLGMVLAAALAIYIIWGAGQIHRMYASDSAAMSGAYARMEGDVGAVRLMCSRCVYSAAGGMG
jgi:hypothetical protein